MRVDAAALKILIALMLCPLALACSDSGTSDPNPADTDTDADENEQTEQADFEPVDGENDAPGCQENGCPAGLFCDESDGRCKACGDDGDCGAPDPLTGVMPICEAGRCRNVICSSMVEIPDFVIGETLPSQPVSPEFDERGVIFPTGSRTELFPVGIEHLKAKESLYLEAAQAGANLVISGMNCCREMQALEYQIESVLHFAQEADLFSGLVPLWPPEQIEDDENILYLKNAIAERAEGDRYKAPLIWLGAKTPQAEGYTPEIIGELAGFVKDADNQRPFAVSVEKGAQADYLTSANLTIASFDDGEAHVGDEIARFRSETMNKPVWARLEAKAENEAWLISAGLHAVAHGATGLIFSLPDETEEGGHAFETAKQAARFFRNLEALWLSPKEMGVAEIIEDDAALSLLAVRYESKHFLLILANISQETKAITLKLSFEEERLCIGDWQHEPFTSLQREKTLNLSLSAQSFTMLQVSTPGDAGESTR